MIEQMELFESAENLVSEDNKYTKTIKIPQYVPSEQAPQLAELYNSAKYSELLSHINSANVPDDVKGFLRLAASRHIVFNYAKIADYYAHTTPDIQRLFEESALVILDVNDAIANGYVRLSDKMKEMITEQKKKDGKE